MASILIGNALGGTGKSSVYLKLYLCPMVKITLGIANKAQSQPLHTIIISSMDKHPRIILKRKKQHDFSQEKSSTKKNRSLSKELDSVVGLCLDAENEKNEQAFSIKKENAQNNANRFLRTLKAAKVASFSFYVYRAFEYLQSGDVLSALDVVFSTLLPRVISKFKKMLTKDKQKRENKTVKPEKKHDPPG